MWEVELAAGSASPRHRLDREEVFLDSAGEAVATMDGAEQQLRELLTDFVSRHGGADELAAQRSRALDA